LTRKGGFRCNMHMVLWSPVGAPAGVPGPRRNADECDAGWFAPVATRRRSIFAGPVAGFAVARSVFPGGYPRNPPAALCLAASWERRPPATARGLATCEVTSWAG